MRPPDAEALIVIDMQRDFLDPAGYIARSGVDVSVLRAPIPNVRRLLQGARAAGIPVIHTREGHRPDLTDLNAVKARRAAGVGAAIGSHGPLGRLLVRGERGHAIVDELAPLPSETVIDKPGFGAFYATDLELVLRAAGVGTLTLAGVTTDVCVHSTLREAVDRGFECRTVGDACAAADAAIHEAMLACIAGEGGILGRVVTTAEVVTGWSQARRLTAAAPSLLT
ncbi:MAG TPA: isochorismatase family cysteine hydrolase [Steroidobacteraceae bacterium]|nr:isochorismatase family cysteine hydrolase [Steroidobacteraceae bacterium]